MHDLLVAPGICTDRSAKHQLDEPAASANPKPKCRRRCWGGGGQPFCQLDNACQSGHNQRDTRTRDTWLEAKQTCRRRRKNRGLRTRENSRPRRSTAKPHERHQKLLDQHAATQMPECLTSTSANQDPDSIKAAPVNYHARVLDQYLGQPSSSQRGSNLLPKLPCCKREVRGERPIHMRAPCIA